jgi:hypothetical protein
MLLYDMSMLLSDTIYIYIYLTEVYDDDTIIELVINNFDIILF